MAADLRLKGQEVSIRIVKDGAPVEPINSVASFNDNTNLEIKEDGFLGEVVNRQDEILNSYSGDFEFQVNTSQWITLKQAIESKAKRDTPAVVFNIVRTDLFANGQSLIITYMDVHWGAMPQTIGSRGDFVKVKAEFKCSEQAVQVDAV